MEPREFNTHIDREIDMLLYRQLHEQMMEYVNEDEKLHRQLSECFDVYISDNTINNLIAWHQKRINSVKEEIKSSIMNSVIDPVSHIYLDSKEGEWRDGYNQLLEIREMPKKHINKSIRIASKDKKYVIPQARKAFENIIKERGNKYAFLGDNLSMIGQEVLKEIEELFDNKITDLRHGL